MTVQKFSDFGFSPELAEALEKAQYKEPSPIQAKAIPLLLEKKMWPVLLKQEQGKQQHSYYH